MRKLIPHIMRLTGSWVCIGRNKYRERITAAIRGDTPLEAYTKWIELWGKGYWSKEYCNQEAL